MNDLKNYLLSISLQNAVRVFAFERVCVVVLCLFSVACTNSKLVLRPLYNSLDDRFEDPIFEHADFDESQTREIEELMDHFHVWHRKTQMDGYARLLEDIVRQLRASDDVSADDVERWGEAFSGYRATLASCNPFYASANIIASLSDKQVIDIREHREKEREARRARRAEDDDEEDKAEHVKQTKRYLGLIGLDLNQQQLDDFSDTMDATLQPETPMGPLREKLDTEMYALLEKRADPNWEQMLIKYIDDRRQAFADRRKATREHNRELWTAYALRTLQNLESEQKKVAADYLDGLAATTKALAADDPSYQKRGASEYACLGAQISS